MCWRFLSFSRSWAITCALLLVSSSLTLACDPQQSAEGREVKVCVVTIVASETDTKIDPRLECIAKEIQKVYPQYKGFRLAKMTCKSIPVSGSETFAVFADQKATVTVHRNGEKDAGRVQLTITPPTLGEITYTTACGKFFPIMTRYKTKNKEILILAVRCQACNKK